MNLQLAALGKANQCRPERGNFGGFLGQLGFNQPVLYRDKPLNLPLPVNDDFQCGGLDSACGKALSDLAPEQGAEPVADQPVQDAPCLLGIDQLPVYRPGISEGLLDGFAGYLVEDDTPVALPV